MFPLLLSLLSIFTTPTLTSPLQLSPIIPSPSPSPPLDRTDWGTITCFSAKGSSGPLPPVSYFAPPNPIDCSAIASIISDLDTRRPPEIVTFRKRRDLEPGEDPGDAFYLPMGYNAGTCTTGVGMEVGSPEGTTEQGFVYLLARAVGHVVSVCEEKGENLGGQMNFGRGQKMVMQVFGVMTGGGGGGVGVTNETVAVDGSSWIGNLTLPAGVRQTY